MYLYRPNILYSDARTDPRRSYRLLLLRSLIGAFRADHPSYAPRAKAAMTIMGELGVFEGHNASEWDKCVYL